MIGIIGAMAVEVAELKKLLQDVKVDRISGIEFVQGTLSGKDVVVAQSGVGKVFAAICAQTMILKYGVSTIINSGVAGTLTDQLHIGDVAISTGCVEHDMDTSALGDPVGLISGINLITLPTDSKLAQLISEICDASGYRSLQGVIATGDQFICSTEKRQWLNKEFQAIAGEMESGSIAHVCYVNNCPFVAMRVICDEASGESPDGVSSFVVEVAKISSSITQKLIEKL